MKSKIIRRLTGLEKIKCSRCLRFATSVRFVWKLRSHFGFCSALRRLLLTVANSILVGVVRRQDKAKNSCPACQKGWNNQLGTQIVVQVCSTIRWVLICLFVSVVALQVLCNRRSIPCFTNTASCLSRQVLHNDVPPEKDRVSGVSR